MLQTLTAFGFCTKAEPVLLYETPSIKSKVLWTVAKYMPLLEIESKDGWVKVKDLDSEIYWVQKKWLSSSIDCLIIKTPYSALRIGPGSQFKPALMPFADKYSPFKKLDRDGPWLKVQDDYNTIFWIHESQVWEPLRFSNLSF